MVGVNLNSEHVTPINCVNCREYWKYDSHCGLTGNIIGIVHWDFGDYGDDEENCPLLKKNNVKGIYAKENNG